MSNLFTSEIFFSYKIFTFMYRFIFLIAGYFYFMLNSTDHYRTAICRITWKYLSHFILESHILIFRAAILCNSVMKWMYSSGYFEPIYIFCKYLSRKSLIIVACYFSVLLCSSSYERLVTTSLILSPSLSIVVRQLRLIFVRFKMENRIIRLR